MMQGTLELRLGKETLVAASEHGERVFEAHAKLLQFLDERPEPKPHDYKEWFSRTADELLPRHHQDYLGQYTGREVIIDVRRRLIIYDADDEAKWTLAAGPIRQLWSRHGFATYRYPSL